jgi:hypothetical protein
MSTIPSSPLPPATSSVAFDRPAKTSHHGHAHAARSGAQAPASNADSANAPADPATTGLDSALARIQGQNQASALASLADLQEAMAATRSAQQLMQTQSQAARAAHAGVTSAAALRVLEN